MTFGILLMFDLDVTLLGKLLHVHLFRDEDIRIMGQRGEFRGEYSLGVTKGEEELGSTSLAAKEN